jgi:hypothetical protein
VLMWVQHLTLRGQRVCQLLKQWGYLKLRRISTHCLPYSPDRACLLFVHCLTPFPLSAQHPPASLGR